MKWASRYREDEHGSTVVEFAVVLVPFFALVIGGMSFGFYLYTNSQLQQATETAARCYAVETTVCKSLTDVQTYAANHYGGLIHASFTAKEAGCGPHTHLVQGQTDSFALDLVVATIPSITLKSSSCFPQ